LAKKRRKPFCFGLIESPQPCQKRTVFLIYISQDIDIFNPKQMDPGPFVILSPGGETARPAIRWGKSSRIFANRIYSPRQVERQLKEIHRFYMAIRRSNIGCSQSQPNSAETDERCHLRNLFSIDLLLQEGLVKPEHHFPDGTKNGADANQCAFVWRKSIE